MSVFGKSLRDYFLFTRTGLLLLLAVGVARFILGVSGVPYDRVTHLVSMSIVAIVLAVIYGQHVAAREFGGYRHLLVIACLLSATMYSFIILAILVERSRWHPMVFFMRREQGTHPWAWGSDSTSSASFL